MARKPAKKSDEISPALRSCCWYEARCTTCGCSFKTHNPNRDECDRCFGSRGFALPLFRKRCRQCGRQFSTHDKNKPTCVSCQKSLQDETEGSWSNVIGLIEDDGLWAE